MGLRGVQVRRTCSAPADFCLAAAEGLEISDPLRIKNIGQSRRVIALEITIFRGEGNARGPPANHLDGLTDDVGNYDGVEQSVGVKVINLQRESHGALRAVALGWCLAKEVSETQS